MGRQTNTAYFLPYVKQDFFFKSWKWTRSSLARRKGLMGEKKEKQEKNGKYD